MDLYFGGAEIGSHRTILQAQGVTNVAMSYMGLRRRVKFAKPWLIKDKFEDGVNVFLDSGAYTINNDSEADPDELVEIFEHYKTFVTDNLDRVNLVSEFDAMPLGVDWIEQQRDEFWSTIPKEKFLAIWHPVWGIPYLHEMASRYEVIGIPSTSLEGRNLRPILNALAANGTRIHGVAMTRIEEMQSIRWDSVASTSWISPQRYGDTIVWTGKELKRYPMKYKDRARKQHRTLFKNNGFDAEAIAADDSTEVLRLSVWSWKKFEDYVNEHHGSGRVVTPLFSAAPERFEENPEEAVDTQVGEPGNDVPTEPVSKAVVNRRESTTMLPVMGLFKPEDDEDKDTPPTITIRSESARVCNSCFLSEKCPMYEPDSNCAYNIPISVRTREQFKALNYAMLEMQTQRVMFMRMAEEIEGGYADPNLSKEMGLLNKMSAQVAELEREGFSLTIRAQGTAGQNAEGGMMSRIFGSDTGQRVQELEAGPISADDYIEAEIVKDSDDE